MNISSVTGTSTTTTTTGANSLDADSFMKLLIAELQHQDPENPMDSAAMVAQLATMNLVTETRSARQSQDMVQAMNALGKTVTWQDADTGEYLYGEVTSVVREGSDAQLMVGDQQLKLSEIVAISSSGV
jgi:flagellar hook assembly protein FlgD